MPAVKRHLEKLYRKRPIMQSRHNLLRLDMNESVEGLPDDFIDSAIKKIDSGMLARYPEYDILVKQIADHNQVEIDNICLSNGSDGAIKYIFESYIEKGDKVLLTEPSFAMYPVYCKMFDATAEMVQYNENLSFPFERFIDSITDEIKMAVVVNPNNPTGSALKSDEINKIITKCEKNDVLILIDEAYFYFYNYSAIEYLYNHGNIIILRTFSKLCGMAAIRLGYAIASKQIIKNIKKVRPTFDINGLAVLFASAFLNNANLISDSIENVNSGKKFLVNKLLSANIEYITGHANFILIKCNGRVEDIAEKLLKENIAVSWGFKQKFMADYIRVTLGAVKSMDIFWKVFVRIWNN